MKKTIIREVAEMNRLSGNLGNPMPITQDELKKLPPLLQKYFEFTGFNQRDHVHFVRMKQKGMIRTGSDNNWMPFTAEQYYNIPARSFIWHARVRGALGLHFQVTDKYTNGDGHMLVKIAGLYTIADAKGDEIDQGELTRFLSEMSLFPSAFTDERIQWEEIDEYSARATLIFNDMKASGVFQFDEEGRIVNFYAKRYRAQGKYYFLEDWSTPLSAYKEIGDLWLPTEAEAAWNLSSGELIYIKATLTDIEYNNPDPY